MREGEENGGKKKAIIGEKNEKEWGGSERIKLLLSTDLHRQLGNWICEEKKRKGKLLSPLAKNGAIDGKGKEEG